MKKNFNGGQVGRKFCSTGGNNQRIKRKNAEKKKGKQIPVPLNRKRKLASIGIGGERKDVSGVEKLKPLFREHKKSWRPPQKWGAPKELL